MTEHLDIACAQDPQATLRCDYRLLGGGDLKSSVTEVNGEAITGERVISYPAPDDRTDIMFLVDTSDPARQPAIERIVDHIESGLQHAQPHHRFALATFDTELILLADSGTPIDKITLLARALEAKGRTTELYRNVGEAVRVLGRASGSARRALILMSDGLAEDYAYHHEDVVALAREHDVIIHGIGYPRSVAQSVALQTVRRLSDETGGHYVQADPVDFSIPDGVLARMLNATDSGGSLEFDLTRLIAAGVTGELDLPLAFQTEDQSFVVLAPARLPEPAGRAIDSPATVTRPIAAGRLAEHTLSPPGTARPRKLDASATLWPWFLAVIASILVTLAAVLIAIRRVRRSIPAAPSVSEKEPKPLAYIIVHDLDHSRHVIDKTPWRIGRGRTNDLTIADHSVSRLHAEILSNDQGQLLLRDLESLNGVFVNDNRIESIQLREGDSIDIGDARMHFTLHDEAHAFEDPTVLVSTLTPR